MQPDNEPRTARVPEQRVPDAVPEPGPGSSPRALAAPPAKSPGRGVGKRNLLVLLLFGALLLAGGATIAGTVWYDRQTAPDRSSPDVAADNYLRALLVERDETRAGLWACGDRSALAEIEAFRTEILQREEQLHTSISVNLEDLRVDQANAREVFLTVGVRRSALIDGTNQSVVDQFRVRTVDDGGWRVCGAEKQPT